MPSIDVLDIQGKKVKSIELNENIFALDVNQDLIHAVIVNYLANQRQGTQKAKTRAEVRGGGRKPWKQKGTGRARHGSTRSPIWAGGGVVFAPTPRSYNYSMNKKQKRLAIKQIFSDKLAKGEIIVVDELPFTEIKTKPVATALANLDANKKTLILLPELNNVIYRSARNIENVKVSYCGMINAFDLLNNKKIVMTVDTVKKLEEVYA